MIIWKGALEVNIYSVILYLSFIVLGISVGLMIYDSIRTNLMTKRDKAYIRHFAEAFDETNELSATLKKMLTVYDSKTKEYRAVSRALEYLEHSIYGDYETAAKLVEEALYNRKIKETHQIAIQISIQKLAHFSLVDKLAERV